MEVADMLATLAEFLSSDVDHLWMVDDQVYYDGSWDAFRSELDNCDADLLATGVRVHSEEPDWNWWTSLVAPGMEEPLSHGVAALLSLSRFSRVGAEAVLCGVEEGWTGHLEALVPTLVNRAGLKIEDIGGTGGFTPADRIGRWYDRRTWNWQGPVEHVPGLLHYPVPRQTMPLAERRLGSGNGKLNILYAVPVGGAAAELLPEVTEAFLGAGADCWFLQYDEASLSFPEGVRVIRDKGHKWQLALKHLHPEAVSDYDYIFFWDDDLRVNDFNPMRFARIMATNHLSMAQPAIQSPYKISHAITKFRPCPPPLREAGGLTVHPVVGRLTNFVEIMAPVFTRGAWQEFYGYLDPKNRSGWGYDYIPLGRKGIVDAMPVVHTRAVQSIHSASQADIGRFLANQGLFRYAPVEMGWLLEGSKGEVRL